VELSFTVQKKLDGMSKELKVFRKIKLEKAAVILKLRKKKFHGLPP
jgi:hypothetical protein